MGNALEKAEKKAIESTYKGIMTVIEYKKVKDPIYGGYMRSGRGV